GSTRSDSLGIVAGEESQEINADDAGLAVLPISFQSSRSAGTSGSTHHRSVRRDWQHDGVCERVCAEILPALVLGRLYGAERIRIRVPDVVICGADLHVHRLHHVWMHQGERRGAPGKGIAAGCRVATADRGRACVRSAAYDFNVDFRTFTTSAREDGLDTTAGDFSATATAGNALAAAG